MEMETEQLSVRFWGEGKDRKAQPEESGHVDA